MSALQEMTRIGVLAFGGGLMVSVLVIGGMEAWEWLRWRI